MDRRTFMKGGLAACAFVGPPLGFGRKKIRLKNGATLVFQGDSITQSGRHRKITDSNESTALGKGYVYGVASDLLCRFAPYGLQIFNRGVSGDKAIQLRARWEEDCLALRPDVLSILVGVNDFRQHVIGKYEGDVTVYEENLAYLAAEAKRQLPGIILIICEPFYFQMDDSIDRDRIVKLFEGYRSAARRVAAEEEAHFIPLQQVFDEASQKTDRAYWLYDGIHPTIAGAQLIANELIKLFY